MQTELVNPQAIRGEFCETLINLCNKSLAEENINAEPYITHALRAEFREALITMRNHAVIESENNQPDVIESQRIPDENDCATINEIAAMGLRRRERNTGLLRNISRALVRVEADDFGYCETCGDEIGIARLKARPTACLCVGCKETAEKAETQFYKQRTA